MYMSNKAITMMVCVRSSCIFIRKHTLVQTYCMNSPIFVHKISKLIQNHDLQWSHCGKVLCCSHELGWNIETHAARTLNREKTTTKTSDCNIHLIFSRGITSF